MTYLSRRAMITGGLAFAASGAARLGRTAPRRPIRIVIWDEQQAAQKQAYDNFLGNAIADYLRGVGETKTGQPAEFDVKSVRLDDPDQGLPKETLDNCDVLAWWGHQRHGEVKDALAVAIAERVQSGRLGFLGLHAAHFSKPFIECMNGVSIQKARESLSAADREKVKIVTIPGDHRLMAKGEKLTPYWTRKTGPDGADILEVKLPACCFTGVAAKGTPSHLRLLVRGHPIAKGIPDEFTIPHTEIYDGPFYVPTPDVTLFEETWEGGEKFLSGSVWSYGKGRVFYFRPGHETYPVFKQAEPLRVVENAARFLGSRIK